MRVQVVRIWLGGPLFVVPTIHGAVGVVGLVTVLHTRLRNGVDVPGLLTQVDENSGGGVIVLQAVVTMNGDVVPPPTVQLPNATATSVVVTGLHAVVITKEPRF